ncbi:cell wall hydrolase [Rhizobium brockwellii]|uniref:Cell wall hydrolase n=1 Tax=Rhizobium brockwellii TaxID=3019932 RepID=A0ABU3YM86_9HYPH|nr:MULTISPECIES: cell wall hydrolase [Rhizobium]KPN26613.1 ATP-binding protein [Rhizobium brockwellii]MDV4180038.1 cell wall hydrolase [Rhizobium brockwellii]MDV4186960.1 cell wall hydrolase [Rhizobium brockwellii]QIO53114.1 cell wall hydrolase [Rhizobium leguminosarum bv. trifolii]QJX03919.1 cell wall hydrolase [Rhizobium brockwellii]
MECSRIPCPESVLRRKSPSRSKLRLIPENWVSPVIFGLAGWLIFPSVASHADLAAMLAGLDQEGENWRMVLTNSPAGSIHQAELAFAEPMVTGSIAAGAGMVLPDGRKVAFNAKDKGTAKDRGHEDTPDEDRVNRGSKKGRVVAVEQMQPPKDFSAGSILERTKMLFTPSFDLKDRSAFVKPKIQGKEIEIATSFYKTQPVVTDNGVPAMLASLVTSNKADVLATAYAPAAPDYARQSPFDSILAEQDSGRFVPEIGPRDHAWAASVLAPSVFSAREQQCLASGIYFEARGESVKGQAAVAQVILNRVRNPSYPKTICGVVYQNEDWRNRCQFSFACDSIKDRVNSEYHWRVARDVAMAVTSGKIWLPQVGSATHYHAVYVRPKWAKTMEKVGRIGLHVFYRTYGGGWS